MKINITRTIGATTPFTTGMREHMMRHAGRIMAAYGVDSLEIEMFQVGGLQVTKPRISVSDGADRPYQTAGRNDAMRRLTTDLLSVGVAGVATAMEESERPGMRNWWSSLDTGGAVEGGAPDAEPSVREPDRAVDPSCAPVRIGGSDA